MNRLTKWYKIIQLIARKESKETDELDYRWNYPINIGESVQYWEKTKRKYVILCCRDFLFLY